MSGDCDHSLVGAEVVHFCGDCGNHLVNEQWIPSPAEQIARLTDELDTATARFEYERGRAEGFWSKLDRLQQDLQAFLTANQALWEHGEENDEHAELYGQWVDAHRKLFRHLEHIENHQAVVDERMRVWVDPDWHPDGKPTEERS